MLSTLSFTTRSSLGLQRKTKNSAHGRGQQIWMRCQIISVEPCLTDLDWVMVTKGALAWEQPLTQGGAFCHVPIFLPSPPPPSFACFPARALRFHGTPASPLCYPWQYPKIIENTDKSFRPHQVQHGVHGGLDSTTAAVWPSRGNQLVPSHSQQIL